jgi:hypothetical protein
MSIKLRTASDGLVVLQPEDTASEVTVTVPAGTDTLLNTASDIEAQVKTATNATGSAPIYACRAWCNFNGTGTVAIRASGNVSSITDNGIGDYTVNFTTAMPDANYVMVGVARRDNDVTDAVNMINLRSSDTYLTTQAKVRSYYIATPFFIDNNDSQSIYVAIFR